MYVIILCMTTQTLIRKLNKEVLTLQQDVRDIKNVLLMPISDSEGEYRKSFVKTVLARAKEKPTWRFTTKEDFLRHIHGRKK